MSGGPSVNRLAAPLVERLLGDAERLRIAVEREPDGSTVVDAGIDSPGGVEAGLRIAEVCMGGLGAIALVSSPALGGWPWQLQVRSSQPVLACLASQLAGWSLSQEDGEGTWRALGSGPGRALARVEPLFAELGYADAAESTCLVLEVDRRPPPGLAERVASACGVAPEGLTLVLTPTGSLAGTVQIVGRVLEVALHRVHQLGFPLERVVDGMAAAPLPPPAPDFLEAMGRTNDAIIYGGDVRLVVDGPEEEARELARALPSGSSRDYGRPFAEVFSAHGGDFYAIDPLLFSPARAAVTALASGRTFRAGALDEPLVERSFAGGPP